MGGFPPPEVTTITVQPAAFPVTFEYVGQTAGSKEAEVRARVTGIVEKRLYQEGAAGARRAAAVPARRETLRSATRPGRGRTRARPGTEVAGRP
jgi:multidrug efflux pump subunit AcrA (membrane-fusion protein)